MTGNTNQTQRGGAGSRPGTRVRRSALSCGYCGYDLRSHDVNEQCPECQKPVHDALIRQDRREHRMERLLHLFHQSATDIWLTGLSVCLLVLALTVTAQKIETRRLLALVLPCVLVVCVYFYKLSRVQSKVLNFGLSLALLVLLRVVGVVWVDLIG